MFCSLNIYFYIFHQVVNTQSHTIELRRKLLSLGMHPNEPSKHLEDAYTVMLDGEVIGRLKSTAIEDVAQQLRYLKATGQEGVSPISIYIPHFMYTIGVV